MDLIGLESGKVSAELTDKFASSLRIRRYHFPKRESSSSDPKKREKIEFYRYKGIDGRSVSCSGKKLLFLRLHYLQSRILPQKKVNGR
ncbi:hypothetical protein EHQ81_07745 [Leptospira selangorensis]|uniref:Uncharacterized protein n=1 Tax=Leptospira selangorensis TaxID=2484982 RepID=A0A4R9GDI8_9LEPT|nr:hypothetical protein EHO58_03915 [Leptospira selangorensis]TGM16265.1 hypothetical protein EHQ81_07745 [Leptospira selangorensis]TGM17784.1 hypothetical protein EHQ82_11960 [Leptospira selangorensis]